MRKILRSKISIRICTWVLILAFLPATILQADTASTKEYQIKAAFLFNFLKFVDWPEGKVVEPNKPITIGIIGQDQFKDSFEPMKNKQVKGSKVEIIRYQSMEELTKLEQSSEQQYQQTINSIRKCHLLFICNSEKNKITNIVEIVKGHNVLTVGETAGSLDKDVIINMLVEDNKVRFEINLSTAKKAELTIRSQLLRLAKRVVDEDVIE